MLMDLRLLLNSLDHTKTLAVSTKITQWIAHSPQRFKHGPLKLEEPIPQNLIQQLLMQKPQSLLCREIRLTAQTLIMSA
jgi:hypothetical protein